MIQEADFPPQKKWFKNQKQITRNNINTKPKHLLRLFEGFNGTLNKKKLSPGADDPGPRLHADRAGGEFLVEAY